MENSQFIPRSGKFLKPSGAETNTIEEITGGVKGINTDHANIHAGLAFTSASTMTVINGQVGGIFLAIPAGVYVHFKAATVSSNAAITVSILENYVKAGGDVVSALPAINRNRNSSNVSSLTTTGGTNVTATAGTNPLTLLTVPIGANLPAYKVGGQITQSDEWVLKPGHNYAIVFSNASGSSALIGYDLFWYEEVAG